MAKKSRIPVCFFIGSLLPFDDVLEVADIQIQDSHQAQIDPLHDAAERQLVLEIITDDLIFPDLMIFRLANRAISA